MAHTAVSHEAAGSGAERVGLVTYVLCYDALLANASTSLPLLGPDVDHLDIARADAGPVRFEGETFWAPDPHVSKKHAGIRCQGLTDVLENLSTTKSVFVSGVEVTVGGRRALRDGDLIEVGHSLFVYRSVSEAAARSVVASREPLFLGPTVTRAPETVTLVEKIKRLAPSDLSLILLGEPGTGKEDIARQIHEASTRARGPYVAFNCGALQGTLVESELFGHERGAFTGAVAQHTGLVESAHTGTLLLDEIGELPISMQPVLLRAIEKREIRRVGSSIARPVDVRWLSATNADISDPRRFRQDLRERLAGHDLHVPPLRERREDLGALVAHLLPRQGSSAASIKRRAARLLFAHTFPGNIRELRHILEAARILAGGGPIDIQHLPTGLARGASEPPAGETPPLPPSARQQDPGPEALKEALQEARGNKTRAAQLLGAHPRSFARWLEKHSLD